MFRNDGNHLHFSGATGGDVLPIVAALHNLVHKQGYKDVILDFSKAGYLNPKFMLPWWRPPSCIVAKKSILKSSNQKT
jgi:hypothetical protein